jgi:hypothetical protein
VLGFGSAAGCDEAHGDFDNSDFVAFEGEQHDVFGFVAANSESVTVEEVSVGSESGSEGASVAFTLDCVTAIAFPVGCSVETAEETSDLAVVAVASFGPQQPFPHAMMVEVRESLVLEMTA